MCGKPDVGFPIGLVRFSRFEFVNSVSHLLHEGGSHASCETSATLRIHTD